GGLPPTADAEVSALRRYISSGGCLLVDDASAQSGGPFEMSARELLARILPAGRLTRVPREHVLYKSFYLLEGPTGRSVARPDLEAIDVGGRLAVLYSPNDLVGAFARDSLGTWELEVVPGGEGQREKAIRLGSSIGLRITAGLLLLVLLLEPGVEQRAESRVRARIALLLDTSRSMRFPASPGGPSRAEAMLGWLKSRLPDLAALASRFQIDVYGFD